MELVSPITDVVSRVMLCGTKHLDYLELKKNLNELKEKMAQLSELKSDINSKVIAEEMRQMKQTSQVSGWLERVDASEHDLKEILEEGKQHLRRRCLCGYCPKNYWSSYKLGKKVVKKLSLVQKLKSEGVFQTVVENQPSARVQELPEDVTVGLDSVVEKTLNLLGKDDVHVLGLYGVGGVGKTTLLRKINNELLKRKLDFGTVIWVVVSKEINVGTVLETIRERLGLEPWHDSVPLCSRTSAIFNALKKKKFLIFLDDVWEKIDLKSIGVPVPCAQNKSKIVLSTRMVEVCSSMKASSIIEVKSLNREDSWVLFEDIVGKQTLNADPQIPKFAKKIANKCDGLPLALNIIGASMANKTDPREWKHAISELNKSAAMFPAMNSVLDLLKFSYDKLPSRTDQVCFLFCALYPEDQLIVIPTLLQQWIGMGHIHGYDNYEDAINKGHSIIGNLKRACFFENGSNDITVKMHDVIRELGLWIARECGKEEGKVFVKSGHILTEIPMNDICPQVVETISLIETDITHFSNLPICPNLLLFLAPQNKTLTNIMDDFFLSMPVLKFLDLSDSGITKLPTSICELSQLEFLDLSDTKITSLPSEMRNLTKLKYLSFFRMEQLGIIPCGMMKNFSNLEILELQVPKSGDDKEKHVDVDELGFLNKLKALAISISDFKDLEKFVSNPRLCICTRVLSISGCKEITSHASLGYFKQLHDLSVSDSSELKEWIVDWVENDEIETGLFENLDSMVLNNLPELVISWDVNVRNLHCVHFGKLRSIIISRCDAMVDLTWLLLLPTIQTLMIGYCGSLREILSYSNESGQAYHHNTFPNLKELRLEGLPNLQSICSMSALLFPSLELIHVVSCPKLRRLPLDLNSATKRFKEIIGDAEWWNGLVWEDETIKAHFAMFFRDLF